jgi:hypothetical protein
MNLRCAGDSHRRTSMKTSVLWGRLATAAAVCWALAACGGDLAARGGNEHAVSVEECLAACGEGCPAPEARVCASDGERYCNSCVIECHDLAVAEDSTCE